MKTVESELHYSLIKVLINTVIPKVNVEYWILTTICINMVKYNYPLYKGLSFLFTDYSLSIIDT